MSSGAVRDPHPACGTPLPLRGRGAGGEGRPRRALVVGAGNVLRQDDGLGVHLVRALAGRLPPGAEAVDAGTSALDALWEGDGVERLVLVDAVAGGESPGTIYRVPVRDLTPRAPLPRGEGQGVGSPLSLHDLDLPAALALAQLAGARLDGVVLVGMEPAALGWGTELSPEVAARLPALAEAVLAEIGVDPHPACGTPLPLPGTCGPLCGRGAGGEGQLVAGGREEA